VSKIATYNSISIEPSFTVPAFNQITSIC